MDDLTLDHLLIDIRAARDTEPVRTPVAVELGKRQMAAAVASVAASAGLDASDPAITPLTSIDGYRVIAVDQDDHLAVLFDMPAPVPANDGLLAAPGAAPAPAPEV